MQSETLKRDLAKTRETREEAIFRIVVGAGLVLALVFGFLNSTGVINIR